MYERLKTMLKKKKKRTLQNTSQIFEVILFLQATNEQLVIVQESNNSSENTFLITCQAICSRLLAPAGQIHFLFLINTTNTTTYYIYFTV